MANTEPQVSIVVATCNRGAILKEHLAAVLRQDGVDFEAIYVDDGSTDDTPEILARHAAQYPAIFRYVRTENRGPGPARNTGVEMARGKWIVIADDDTFPASHWLLELIAAREVHHADVIAYALQPESLELPSERYLHYRNLLVTGSAFRRDYIGPAFFLMPRDLFLAVGGFTEVRLEAAEDFEFCHRLRRHGATIVFEPSVSVPHLFSADRAGVERRVRATAIDGARAYRMLGIPIPKIAFRAVAKLLAAPLWTLRAYPLDLYGVSLRMEWLFFRYRMWACLRGGK
jgi:GT2 family glycosyltransferase